MFTGLIETTGKIININKRDNYIVLSIKSNLDYSQMNIGDSIACDGACLTVVSKDKDIFTVDASQETIDKTILKNYKANDKINLEQALKVGDRMGGHFVSGHIDITGNVDYIRKDGDSLELAVNYNSDFDKYVIAKGSIAINGISLTINNCKSGWLNVNLIPHTISKTTLVDLKSGSPVNLEFDMIGKYILNIVQSGKAEKLTKEKLLKSGW
ncbi:MAG: riboflavin synthase [candidate division Zixibacteria bacterium]|nr:riboflavin synthase [candidate division Zixibacteria bacterium]